MPELFDQVLTGILSRPGIKRDGTDLDGNYYVDGLWTRFRLGRPKKIGGYREIANGLDGPIRGLHIHSKNPQHIISCFSDDGVQCQLVDGEGRPGGTYSRTPADFQSGSYTWTYSTLFDATGTPAVKLIAHGASTDWSGLDSDESRPVFIGEVTAPDAMEAIPGVLISGGIVVLQPYLFAFGSQGLIMNSKANAPSNFIDGDANAVNVAGTKIVRGMPLRGGANAPAGLFWSLDSLIRASYVGGVAKFRYDTVSDSTILCTNGVVNYDGIYFWPGIDRFLVYNGVVKELPNALNQDFFFENLNWAMRQKVWGTALPRWGEIWWFFPKGTSTECNHAIIYNVRENTWYDTPIRRSTGAQPRVLYFPVWADSQANSDLVANKYRLYRHETGKDAVTADNQSAIRAYFETGSISYATADGAPETPNTMTRITRIEPDFSMRGRMTVSVRGSTHAQAPDEAPASFTFEGGTPFIDIDQQRRVMRLKFESNESEGDFHMGKPLLHVEPGDPHQ